MTFKMPTSFTLHR